MRLKGEVNGSISAVAVSETSTGTPAGKTRFRLFSISQKAVNGFPLRNPTPGYHFSIAVVVVSSSALRLLVDLHFMENGENWKILCNELQ